MRALTFCFMKQEAYYETFFHIFCLLLKIRRNLYFNLVCPTTCQQYILLCWTSLVILPYPLNQFYLPKRDNQKFCVGNPPLRSFLIEFFPQERGNSQQTFQITGEEYSSDNYGFKHCFNIQLGKNHSETWSMTNESNSKFSFQKTPPF